MPLLSTLTVRQSNPNNPDNHPTSPSDDGSTGHAPGAWAWFILAIFVVLILVFAAWFIYSHLRARRLGLPPPSLIPFRSNNRINNRSFPARGGPLGWAQAKYRSWRTGRRMRGGYEGARAPGGSGTSRALDPDEAWDARVGAEADEYGGPYGAGYEEQHVGLNSRHGRADSELSYLGGRGRGYGPQTGLEEITEGRGRSPRRELDERYEEATGQNPFDDESERGHNPFGDAAERSHMPLRGVSPRPHEDERRKTADSERRSVFHEQM